MEENNNYIIEESKKNDDKIILIVLLIFIFIIVVGGISYFVFSNKTNKNNKPLEEKENINKKEKEDKKDEEQTKEEIINEKTSTGEDAKKLDLDDIKLKKYLPVPKRFVGKINNNTDEQFFAEITKVELSDFDNYVKLVKSKGFNIDIEEYEDKDYYSKNFKAHNKESYFIVISYDSYQKNMSITLNKPLNLTEFTWPEKGLAAMLPKPKSNVGQLITNDKSFNVIVGSTNIQEFNNYVKEIQNKGFNLDQDKTNKSYQAKNKENYKVSIFYKGANQIEIYLKKD